MCIRDRSRASANARAGTSCDMPTTSDSNAFHDKDASSEESPPMSTSTVALTIEMPSLDASLSWNALESLVVGMSHEVPARALALALDAELAGTSATAGQAHNAMADVAALLTGGHEPEPDDNQPVADEPHEPDEPDADRPEDDQPEDDQPAVADADAADEPGDGQPGGDQPG